MKKATYFIISIALLAIVVVWLLNNKEKANEKVYRHDKQREVAVTADTVKLRDLQAEKKYSGTFEPDKEVKVMADFAGKVDRMYADLGDYLRTGELVAQLDNALLKLQLEGIRVQIAGYQKDVDRYKILVREEAIQAIQLEKTELALQSTLIQEKTLQEQIRKTTITAPFSGIVTRKFTEVGAVVAMSMPVIQLTDISLLRLNLTIPESDLNEFHTGQQLLVGSNALPGQLIPGEVIMVGGRGDAAHNFPVQVRISNLSDQALKAGMFGWVRVNRDQSRSLPVIPSNALFGSSLHQKVYVVNEGIVSEREIEVAYQTDEYTAVASGLRPGEVVVTSGFINLKQGSRVNFK